MSQHILYISDGTFEAEVLQSAVPVLVDYWAEWCGPCKMIAPILDEVAKEYGDRLKDRKTEYRRKSGYPAKIRHPRYPYAHAFQKREYRGNQGRRVIEIPAYRFY